MVSGRVGPQQSWVSSAHNLVGAHAVSLVSQGTQPCIRCTPGSHHQGHREVRLKGLHHSWGGQSGACKPELPRCSFPRRITRQGAPANPSVLWPDPGARCCPSPGSDSRYQYSASIFLLTKPRAQVPVE